MFVLERLKKEEGKQLSKPEETGPFMELGPRSGSVSVIDLEYPSRGVWRIRTLYRIIQLSGVAGEWTGTWAPRKTGEGGWPGEDVCRSLT